MKTEKCFQNKIYKTLGSVLYTVKEYQLDGSFISSQFLLDIEQALEFALEIKRREKRNVMISFVDYNDEGELFESINYTTMDIEKALDIRKEKSC